MTDQEEHRINMECYIEGKNLVNGVETKYQIAEGAVFTKCYNETLDSGTIILPQLSSKIDIAPYDIIIISGDNIDTRRMCVDSYDCIQTCLGPAIYQYEISLFSETKLLEGILLPSLAITKNLNNPRNISYYITQYVREYSPKIYSNGSYIQKITVGNLPSKFNDDCPELQWNEPTLREVLTDLMMVKDCIPVLSNNIISYIDISDIGSEIEDFSGINFIHESQSSTDYLSELKMNLKNAIGSINTVYDKIGFRNYNNYLLSTENVKIETTNPIWDLKSLFATMAVNYTVNYYIGPDNLVTDTGTETITADLTNYVLEQGIWSTKPVYYAGFNETMPLNTDYQNTCLYYTRGANGINNFEGKQDGKSLWVSIQISVLELVFNYIFDVCEDVVEQQILEQIPEANDFSFSFSDNSFKDIIFNITYNAVCNQTFLASKENKFNIKQVIDNQTQSYIDIQRQGMLEYFKANRLGNKLKLINARYTKNENEIPDLAEKINGSIIFQKEISVYENHINVNYSATENYVLRDYFTGIKAKLRSWPILSGNEAFVRTDIIKFFTNNTLTTINTQDQIIPAYSDLQTYMNNFNYCIMTFNDENGNSLIPSTVKYNGIDTVVNAIQVEFQKAICGNSVLFTIKLYDNTLVGRYIVDDNYNISPTVEYMVQQDVYYVDGNGENFGGVIEFYANKYVLQNEMDQAKLLPYSYKAYFYNQVAKIPFTFHKDNKEITQITIQFELNEDANDIFLGKV